jgi:arylsulfatase A-like enzyme
LRLATRFHRVCAVLLGAWLAAGCAGGGDPGPPDVVLIVIDSLRADHLDHLGYALPTAAGLDALRSEATLFTRATTPAPAALPAMASLFTGWFPERHGVDTARDALPAGRPTLAELLHERGYATGGLTHHARLSRAAGFGRGFDRYEHPRGAEDDYADASELFAWLREWLASGPPRPFFVFLHAMNPHPPYRVPPDHRADLLGHPPARDFRWNDPIVTGIRRGRIALRIRFGRAQLQSLVEQYDTAVRYTTDRVGEMLELLRRTGVYDGALVVVVSDHGEELFDHGGFGHGDSLHGEQLHVPLYVKLPHQHQGRRVDVPVSILDLYPTLLEAAGVTPPPGDGRSLLPLLGDAPPPERWDRVFYYRVAQPRAAARGIVDGRFKLVEIAHDYQGNRDVRRLYDLSLDPGEKTDVSAQGPEVAERLAGELERAFADFRSAEGSASGAAGSGGASAPGAAGGAAP